MTRDIADAWGRFLGAYPWTWFLTLTFSPQSRGDGVDSAGRDTKKADDGPSPFRPRPIAETSAFRAHRIFETFTREIEKSVGAPVAWFRADEYGPQGGRLHLHALMTNTESQHRWSWMKRWEELAGYARILPFDPARGAAFYCAKYVAKQFGDWAVSSNLAAQMAPSPATQASFWPGARTARKQDDAPRSTGPSYPLHRNTVEDRLVRELDANRKPLTSEGCGRYRR